MPSKKHRPIVMNRNKRPDKTNSIFKKAVLITAFLAFIEIIILLVIHFKNTNKIVSVAADSTKETLKVPVRDTLMQPAVLPSKIAAANTPTESVAKKDTIEIRTPAAQMVANDKQQTEKDSIVSKPVKAKETNVAKILTQEKMFKILNQVRLEKLRANNTARCISIQIISSSNARNGSEIANYLRKNGYIISGREVIPGSQKGILINASETCIKLSIGDL